MKSANDMVDRYMMIIDISSSLGLDFAEVIEMDDHVIYGIYRELKESRVPNHLGFSR